MSDTSPRTEGMINASADYYQENEIFSAIQNAQALEYDRIESNNADLALQLSPLTATWGLIYWEESVGLPMHNNTDYEARRPAVLAKLAKAENFSADMIHTLVQAYGKHCTVTVDVNNSIVTVTFTDGLPSLLDELQDAIESIIHAHLGTVYKVIFSYLQLESYTHEKLSEFTHGELQYGIPVEGVT